MSPLEKSSIFHDAYLCTIETFGKSDEEFHNEVAVELREYNLKIIATLQMHLTHEEFWRRIADIDSEYPKVLEYIEFEKKFRKYWFDKSRKDSLMVEFDSKKYLHDILARPTMYVVSVEAFLVSVSLCLRMLGEPELAKNLFWKYARRGNAVDTEFILQWVDKDWAADVAVWLESKAPHLFQKEEETK